MGIMNYQPRLGSVSISHVFLVALSLSLIGGVVCHNNDPCQQTSASDKDYFEFIRGLQYSTAEFMSCSSTGKSTDAYEPSLAAGGPPPRGCQNANLDPMYRRKTEEFAYKSIGEQRATESAFKGRVPPRPQIDLSKRIFSDYINQAFTPSLDPQFDPYANSLNHAILAQHLIYNNLLCFIGIVPKINDQDSRSLLGKIIGVESGKYAIYRDFLYQRGKQMVSPYNKTVEEFTTRLADLGNRLGKCGRKDEGIEVPLPLGAEGRTESNVIAADNDSLMYGRVIKECLRVVYGTGNEGAPGVAYPNGLGGDIANQFLRS